MRRNDLSNLAIKWLVIVGDFILLNAILLAFARWHWRMGSWPSGKTELFFMVSNIALVISLWQFPTITHKRLIGAGDIVRRLLGLTVMQAVLAFLLMKVLAYSLSVGWLLWEIGTVFMVLLVLVRLGERRLIKLYRERGRNTRMVIFVGTDPEQEKVYNLLKNDLTLGYRVVGFYGDELDGVTKLGTLEDLQTALEHHEELPTCDEVFLCVPRRQSEFIRLVSDACDHLMVRFFYVPVAEETIGMNLKRKMFEDMELYTTYRNPLENPVNRLAKRVMDIVLAMGSLTLAVFAFPLICLMIKLQSPGPIFFKQLRTGLDGKNFYCYKFRSMHVNADADRKQATMDDPRKFPFGSFMRRTNIDEIPQFWNVLKGDMSVVGPRPHMVAHTEQYSQLINKYMVRHFVKPGMTGWAQMTGFRGETKEVWQMEERVKRDIWYMEHWSIWLDIRIIWLTIKSLGHQDEHAY